MSHAHPIVAAIFDRMTESAERKVLGRIRERIVGSARGLVVEIGAGTGRNFSYYRAAQVEQVIASEPDPYMRRRAEPRAAAAAVPIRLVEATAERIPVEDSSVDTVVSTLVFCSVDDPRQAAREIRRVLKRDGVLLLVEHVRSDDRGRARLQDFLTPLWRRIGANCHPNRPTVAVLEAAGFVVREEERLAVGAPWVQPLIVGTATLS